MMTGRIKDEKILSRLYACVSDLVIADYDKWNAYRVVKAAVGKKAASPLLATCLKALTDQLESTGLGAKTVAGQAQRSMMLQKLITRIHNSSGGREDQSSVMKTVVAMLTDV